MSTYDFPTDFLWGAATSAHQVEGNNFGNDWWEAETSGRLAHQSLEACRHYDLFEQDFDLAQRFGHSAHRFSIEWSRIQPEDDRWDPGALLHYQRVVGSLLDRGIEPILTLHHFTNPLWLARRGGWTRPETVDHFSRYVERVASGLDGVRYWVTINEPTIYAKHGYVYGDWPPFRNGDWLASFRVLRNMARAHVRAYEILHERQPGAQVGLAHSAPWIVPCDPESIRDRLAAAIRDFL
ncbi:MAG: family 1 glycosylhydrolase, partial [Gaiellaceae bacterium]